MELSHAWNFQDSFSIENIGATAFAFFQVLYKASNKVIQKFQFFLLMVLYYSDASMKVVPWNLAYFTGK